MQIQSVKNSEDGSTWKVTLTDGIIRYVPTGSNNRHARNVLEWVARGGVIEPADPPPPLPTDDELIDMAGPVMVAFLKVYAKRENVTMKQIRDAIKAEL